MVYPFKSDPYVIAEIGSCHDGRLSLALSLIEGAANAGADAVKFQLYDAQRLCARRNAQPFFYTYAKYQVPHAWLRDLRIAARENQVALVLSVYDTLDLEAASGYADVFKVSSFESEDYRLIEACHATGKPVIVSTGITTGEDLRTLHLRLKMLDNCWLLHCVSDYPTQIRDLNLSTIQRYRLDGFSDHSRNTMTGALAVCQGARILEVHIRARGTSEQSPDVPHALDLAQLFEYVRAAQQAKASIGTPRAAVLGCERKYEGFKVRPGAVEGEA